MPTGADGLIRKKYTRTANGLYFFIKFPKSAMNRNPVVFLLAVPLTSFYFFRYSPPEVTIRKLSCAVGTFKKKPC